jgi:tetratricopeptide (TPR) repeat protein
MAPWRADLHALLGTALVRLSRWAEAEEAYGRAVAQDPEDARSLASRAVCLNNLGRFEEALESVDTAMELGLDSVHVRYVRAYALKGSNRLEEALEIIEALVRMSPESANLHGEHGQILLQLGRHREALAALDEAVRRGWEKTEAAMGQAGFTHFNRGVCLMRLGKLPEAVAAHRKAVSMNPGDADFHAELGGALAGLRRYEEALAAFDGALERDRGNLSALRGKLLTLHRLGRFEEAIAFGEEALRMAPDDPALLSALAWVLSTSAEAESRDPAVALELAERADRLDPESGRTLCILGAARYRAGLWEEALEALEAACGLREGGDSNVWFLLSMVRWRLGDKVSAREWFDRAAAWMEEHGPDDPDRERFRAEAAELLGIGR